MTFITNAKILSNMMISINGIKEKIEESKNGDFSLCDGHQLGVLERWREAFYNKWMSKKEKALIKTVLAIFTHVTSKAASPSFVNLRIKLHKEFEASMAL